MGLKTHEVVTYNGQAHYAWLVWCPACEAPHSFDDRWTFNGDHEKPSFQASMLVHEVPTGPEQEAHGYHGHPRCHSFLTDGVWNYLSDCTHEMAGKKVEAPDWSTTRFGRMDAHGVVREGPNGEPL